MSGAGASRDRNQDTTGSGATSRSIGTIPRRTSSVLSFRCSTVRVGGTTITAAEKSSVSCHAAGGRTSPSPVGNPCDLKSLLTERKRTGRLLAGIDCRRRGECGMPRTADLRKHAAQRPIVPVRSCPTQPHDGLKSWARKVRPGSIPAPGMMSSVLHRA